MSEEKLYMVKNDEGKYWDFSANSGFWSSEIAYPTTTIRKKQAERVAELVAGERGGHVVTLVEEPKKVVLTKEQAEIVKGANKHQFPANYITLRSSSSDEEKLIMEAYANGYTMAKEKKYNVKLTEEEIEHFGLQDCDKEEVTNDGK
ncbi:DUF1642 domain-containing protein [Loigolactobacillus backii]|uniref:DUF1642 domain-containing protein n=1 Tax=Loigolactobacillus backii TaxID=375175 RepID=UPI0007F15DAD|nr:DUF1642 domain-containing protein [Loigolactobacillus backii]ANK60042.1 hypothetical protein AYR52_07045 [Loigolactobacillus backii]